VHLAATSAIFAKWPNGLSTMQESERVELQNQHIVEAVFHDKKAAHGQEFAWYHLGVLDSVHRYAMSLLGDVNGKTMVEFGCGQGDNALRFAEHGARVFAFDISEEMVNIVKERARSRNLGCHLQVETMPAENLRYPAKFADCAFGGAVLHHTRLPLTQQEVYRVLKPGG
jgi:ubiquinone/menaquinone biosynthesis C-methylase UbiE